MYQAIVTRFIGPTNHRGARVIAKAEAGRVTVSWDHAIGVEANHAAAAKALADKWGWSGKWYGGSVGTGYAFVSTRESSFERAAFCVEEG